MQEFAKVQIFHLHWHASFDCDLNAKCWFGLFVESLVTTEFVAVMRRHGATSASLCDQSLYAISKFSSGDARNRLRRAGFCEGTKKFGFWALYRYVV